MAAASPPLRLRKELPRSQRRYAFALTPLADAMFQLLIFFMLSSSLTPYSLLTLTPGAGNDAAGETPAEAQATLPDTNGASWVIDQGSILAGGQRFGFDALPQLAGALSAAQTANVVLISSGQARVQDMVTVLEALSAAGITAVQIVAGVTP